MIHRTKHTRGFTIVELLIVIVVIAILAAISVAAYNGIVNRANNSAVQADLKNLAMKVNEYQALNGELPVGQGNGNPAFFSGIRFKPTRTAYMQSINNLYYCAIPSGPNAGYAIAARSKSGDTFSLINGTPGSYSGGWSSNLTICAAMGINTSDPLYNFAWGQTTANAWNGWID